ncbi:MAG: outer membrane beta-barrel protein [Bacteroides sp.]|nr:outer membrane beta-barrel protein [Bacteroides sp.]
MASFKSIALSALCLASASMAVAQEVSYIPQVHGTVRSRWELDTRSGDSRFRVRNARLSVGGYIAPSIDYFVQAEFDGNDHLLLLDAYGRFRIIKGLTVQGGQFRMPFGVESFRAPNNYYFANRSFMGKQMMNYRALGAKVVYAIPKTPLTAEFGGFNPVSLHKGAEYSHAMACAGKLSAKLPMGWTLSGGYASIKPDVTRSNLADFCIEWNGKHVYLAAEYMYQHYVHDAYKDAHSYVAFADWHKDVKWGVFNRWSIQGRFDGMTDQQQLATGSETFNFKRNRATIGSTLTYTYKALHADVRLNYEKYFDWKGGDSVSDCFVTELVVRF